MITFDFVPLRGFLLLYAIGGSICGATWYCTRRLLERSRPWRAVFCMLVGATIAPSFVPIFEFIVVLPAVVMLRGVFDGGRDPLWCFFVFGVSPIVLTGSVIFFLWSYTNWRRHRHARPLL